MKKLPDTSDVLNLVNIAVELHNQECRHLGVYKEDTVELAELINKLGFVSRVDLDADNQIRLF